MQNKGKNIFSVPDGYFTHLESNLSKVTESVPAFQRKEKQVFLVPEGYFNWLPVRILNAIRAKAQQEDYQPAWQFALRPALIGACLLLTFGYCLHHFTAKQPDLLAAIQPNEAKQWLHSEGVDYLLPEITDHYTGLKANTNPLVESAILPEITPESHKHVLEAIDESTIIEDYAL